MDFKCHKFLKILVYMHKNSKRSTIFLCFTRNTNH